MELEHCTPKARYLRTSRKNFEKELGEIERRQARIRHIRQRLDSIGNKIKILTNEKGPVSSNCRYHIGKTQNHPVNLAILSQDHMGDPAAKVYNSFNYLTTLIEDNHRILPTS